MSDYKKQPNELHRELLGPISLSPWTGTVAASRQQMFSSHLGQMLVISNPTARKTVTGSEFEIGEYTFNVKMPENGGIIKVIDRFRKKIGDDTIKLNPQTVVLYENDDNEIGLIELTNFCSNHPTFGFSYKKCEGISELRPGNAVSKGVKFLDSPAIDQDGNYRFGIGLNMAYMSMPGVAEDGIIICRDVLPRLKTKKYVKRTVSWGGDRFPLNIYGDEKHYKPFPDIGEYVSPPGLHDGLLMVLRHYDEELVPVDQNIYNTRIPDPLFDAHIYAEGSGGRVVDINVFHEPPTAGYITPEAMCEQIEKYEIATREFYNEILSEYHRLKKQRGNGLVIMPEFQRLLVEALNYVCKPNNAGDVIRHTYRNTPLDEWYVEFTIEYEVMPDYGFKLTDGFGGF